jgi:hypothetical protein
MHRPIAVAALVLAAACTPTFNWREVPIESTGLKATFPCKPDKAERSLEFAPGRSIVVHAVGCETGGASFAVLYGDVGQPGEVAAALAQWKQASLAASKSHIEKEERFQPAGALEMPGSTMTRAAGQHPDGRAVQSQAAYFARGTKVFQVVVWADRLKPDMTEPFFAGLRFE